jgi:hypothetical protein
MSAGGSVASATNVRNNFRAEATNGIPSVALKAAMRQVLIQDWIRLTNKLPI